MIHSSLNWTEIRVDDLYLLSFAVKQSIWVYNQVQNQSSGITPMEMLTKKMYNNWDLRRSHVWGCPVYVLEDKLQNNQKLPKWNRRARLGHLLSFSEENSTLVANVCHIQTGYISPQYHPFFDDFFETAFHLEDNDPLIDNI